jgi:hypothetical protein
MRGIAYLFTAVVALTGALVVGARATDGATAGANDNSGAAAGEATAPIFGIKIPPGLAAIKPARRSRR